MEMDRVDKRELLRLNAGSWSRRNSARRWEFMCELREEGKSWKEMGAWINRHWTTAQRLWRRGWLERQRKVAVCRDCGNRLIRTGQNPRYVSPSGPGVKWRWLAPQWLIFRGHCDTCDTQRWSWPFKLYSYEQVKERIDVNSDLWKREGFKVYDHKMVCPRLDLHQLPTA